MVSGTKPMSLVLALIILACLQEGVGSKVQDQSALPSLESIKGLEYTKAAEDKSSDNMGYSAIRAFIEACQSYAKGHAVLPNFHEPVLTRGDSGISVFRKVSPSVVLVLTANVKDDKITDSALGTGVIVDSAGYVLTNWHVVAGYDTGIIFFKPQAGTVPDYENSAYGVKLVAMDKQADLALLKIVKPPSGLIAVQFEARASTSTPIRPSSTTSSGSASSPAKWWKPSTTRFPPTSRAATRCSIARADL